MEQLKFFDVTPLQKEITRIKRNWLACFQRWSDKQSQVATTSEGKCGYGAMCDYCDGNHNGHECARALNAMLRDLSIQPDYKQKNFDDYWSGDL